MCLYYVQSTLPTIEGLHETSSRINSGTDLLQLFHVNELNEVVERSDFKVAIPLCDTSESVKVPLSCLSSILARLSCNIIYIYILGWSKSLFMFVSCTFSYTKKMKQRKREKNRLFDHTNIFKHIHNTMQNNLCCVRLPTIFFKNNLR